MCGWQVSVSGHHLVGLPRPLSTARLRLPPPAAPIPPFARCLLHAPPPIGVHTIFPLFVDTMDLDDLNLDDLSGGAAQDDAREDAVGDGGGGESRRFLSGGVAAADEPASSNAAVRRSRGAPSGGARPNRARDPLSKPRRPVSGPQVQARRSTDIISDTMRRTPTWTAQPPLGLRDSPARALALLLTSRMAATAYPDHPATTRRPMRSGPDYVDDRAH